jgi:hypothetical protein
LRFRQPVYRTLRELAISYFEDYYNLKREKTLRGYSRPVRLTRFDARAWMTAEQDVWFVSDYLFSVHHTPLLTPAQIRALTPVDRRTFESGLHGSAK